MSEPIHLVELSARVVKVAEECPGELWAVAFEYQDERGTKRTETLYVPSGVPIQVGGRVVLCVEMR